jgi:hypothetical protein
VQWDFRAIHISLTRGLFPALWRDTHIPSDAFYQSYLATYIERDVRQLLNIGSLRDFERFLRACAIRSADTSTMDTVAHVFAMAESSAYRVKGALLLCRTPEHFAPAAHVRVVNGFRLREVVATL